MNLVSNTFSSLKNSPNHDYMLTPEEINARNSKMLTIVDTAIDKFLDNLQKGKVKLRSSVDLDRLVKLALLLSQDLKKPVATESNNATHNLPNDPLVKELYQKLYDRYNQQNDID